MRASTLCADSSAICSKLSLEVAKLFDRQDWLFGDSSKHRPRTRRRTLQIEPLELRQLMDATGLAALISPTWFQSVADQTGPQHAAVATWTAQGTIVSNTNGDGVASIMGQADNLYDWIVQFDTASLAGISSVAETTSLLAGGGIDFQAIAGLGMTGQVLVRSSGAAFDAVQSWLAGAVHVASFEQDAVGQLETVPNDPQLSSTWGMTKINAPSAWSVSTGSQSVVVGIIDTGVDYTHPDLAANIWTNPGEIVGNGIDDDANGFVDDIHGYDFVNNDGNPMDDNNHGTHVAGTIAAVGNNATGVAGVNWSSSVMALKFLSSTGSGYLSDAVRALNYATMMRSRGVNIRVTNNSWGGGGFSTSLQTAIQANSDAGILFVAAAGNSAGNNDVTPNYPSNYTSPNVIAVAASDSNDQLASFSCYGATTVDIAAPGVGIYSTLPGNRYGSMSGTSMATPHVAGVAALAFAAAPNATMAQVRDAILQGADPVAAFSGKMVTGGRLNAYNTLLRLNTQPQGPAVGSFTVSPNTVMAGSVITLSAQSITDSLGTVTSVSFYRDSNNNGQYDTSDTLVGSDTTIVSGQASITVNTTGFAPGAYRYFARALDNGSRWSTAVATVATVLAADDHGNNAAGATTVGTPSATQGTLGIVGDVDWLKFQAVAGRTYILSTVLGTLSDSVLTLYDRNGTTQLEENDDDGATLASKITWTASASGTYYVAVSAYNDLYAGTYTLNVQPSNVAPVLSPISNQTMTHSQTTLTLPLTATDADGDSLTYSVQVGTVDAMAQKAYNLDQQLGLYQANGTYYTNFRGANEKYMLGTGSLMYFILPTGALYCWGGSLANSTLVDTLTPTYYANPALLHNAQQPTFTPISDVQASISGNRLTMTRPANYNNDFYVQVSVSDGLASDSETFNVSVTNSAPVLATVGNQTMSHRQTSLAIPLSVSDADGDTLSYTVQVGETDPMAQKAYDLDQQLGLYKVNGTYYTNFRGANEKYMLGNGGLMYFILPTGALYCWGGSIANSTLVDTLAPAYYADPALLHDAQAPTSTPTSDVQASLLGNVLTITRSVSYSNDFYVRLSVGDGLATDSETFKVSVTNSAPVLATVGNQTMSHQQTSLAIPLSVTDADGDTLTYTIQAGEIDPVAQKAYDLDQQLGLYQVNGTYYTNFRGVNEKYMLGNGGLMYFILPTGALYCWGGSIAGSTLVDTLTPAYYTNPALLHDAQAPTFTPISDVQATMSGNVLTINRALGYSSDFYVRVSVSDGSLADSEMFKVCVTNSAPVLATVGDHTMASGQYTMAISLSAVDADGDTVTYTAQVGEIDPMAQKAYDLDQQLGLYQANGTYYTNFRGINEKYMLGNGNLMYFILPTGALYCWGGSISSSTLVDTLTPAYYADPALLHEAQTPALTFGANVQTSLSGNVLTITRAPGYTSEFHVRVNVSDGLATDTEMFGVSVASTSSLQTAEASSPTLAATAGNVAEQPSVLPYTPMSTSYMAMALASSLSTVRSDSTAFNTASPLATSSALYDNAFTHLTSRYQSPREENRRWTVLDNQLNYLLSGHLDDVRLPRTSTALFDNRERFSAAREEAAEDLLACSPVERQIVDEVFDLLSAL